MRSVLVFLLVLGLVGAGTALAGRGDPQKRIAPADQSRAKAMLLREADFGLGFRAGPTPTESGDLYCKALDESDLTLTGESRSATFTGGVETYWSVSQVYRSRSDSDASWRRGTSTAGLQCLRTQFRRVFASQGGRLESLRRVPFPRLAEKTVAYRLTVSTQGLRAFLDVVALKQGRAHTSLLMASVLTPVPSEEERRLARAVARRMKTAMRGA